MQVINIHQAKTQFSRLVEQVIKGEVVIIGKAGKPVVQLVPYTQPQEKLPEPGLYSGQITIGKDFDAQSPEIIEMFYGNEDA